MTKNTVLSAELAEKRAETKKTFKQDWSDKDFKAMKQALKRSFVMKPLQTKDGQKVCYTYSQLEELLGLPYTSSSSFAGVWVTNTELHNSLYPSFNYIGFAIAEDGKCYGILWDKEENEIIVKL
jgi:hypothetical protein